MRAWGGAIWSGLALFRGGLFAFGGLGLEVFEGEVDGVEDGLLHGFW
ncbi:MAG: hypothetical protein RI897_3151 [Verrucomicrobiota bacterium]